MFYENLYPRMASNFGFGGAQQSLPLEVCLNLMEFFIFFDDTDQEHLLDLISYLLEKQREKYIGLSSDNLQRYISNGKFVTETFMDKESYDEMVAKFLRPLFNRMQDGDDVQEESDEQDDL